MCSVAQRQLYTKRLLSLRLKRPVPSKVAVVEGVYDLVRALWYTAAAVPQKVAHAASQWPAPSKVAVVEGVYDLRVLGCVRCTMCTIHMTVVHCGN